MNKIIFPLKLNMQWPAVADLQDALQLCLERRAILANDEVTRQELSIALKDERNKQMYGDITWKLVRIFQEERHLPTVSGEVDEPTTNALNNLLREWEVLDQPTETAALRSFVVSGQVRREDSLPLPGVRVRAMHEASENVLRLGEDTADAEGRYLIRYEPLPGVDGINLRLTVFDTDGKLLHNADIIQGAKPLEIVNLIVPGIDIKPYRVKGKVASRVSASMGGLRVLIVDKGVGGNVPLAETSTNENGTYQATFSDSDVRGRGKAQPDLQTRVFAGDTFLGASDVHYNASFHETLNILLEDKAVSSLQSEHEVLTSALVSQFKGKLSDLKETDEQQDITYLANKTGWDARAVALAALADQFSARTGAGSSAIPQAFFYALFRAGLPANEDTLYHTDAKALEGVWKQAVEQGVIPKNLAGQIPDQMKRFQAMSAEKLLAAPALVGASSLKEMLTLSGLNKQEQQEEFAKLYAANRTDMKKFWDVLVQNPPSGVTPDEWNKTVNRLKVDGKLGFLTINNAPLIEKVHATVGSGGLSDPLQLAQMGYHDAEPWKTLLTDVPIPKEIPGATLETKRANYANYLAAQVRLSYPTAAIAHMIKNGDLKLTDTADGISDKVHEFLTEHQGKFEIGVQPVEQYIKRNVLKEEEVPDAAVVTQIKRLQRVYQITPSDQAMIGLMKRGIDSAYHVVPYDKETFIHSFAADLGGADQAELVYDRSVQVHNVVLNIALSYQTAQTAPAIGINIATAPANAGDIIAYATLESLFGSMDFCACDHCRSLLSPAAYLVDLLLFLQSDPTVWADSLKTWKKEHSNAPYPFVDQKAWQKFQDDWNRQHPGQPLPDTEISPFDVLISRRPDIEHLPLTCENTNTALPYIDIVNETLEYFVVNAAANTAKDPPKPPLDGYVGYDSNGIASEDLLASPQHVMDSAYATLSNERFPLPLPFHRPLENLRHYFNKFEVPLPLAMERLRQTDDLERGANSYGWRDILMEEIGLSRDEYKILTNSTTVPFRQMYGFSDEEKDEVIIAGLSNAKRFARRVGVTYEDLVSILKTRFINPNSDLIPKLERLDVSFASLKAFKDGTLDDTKFDDMLPKGVLAPDPAEYDGDIKTWVKLDNNYNRIMGLITLAIPAGTWAASKDYAKGDCVLPSSPPTRSTLYYECTTAGKSTASEPKWPTTPGNTCSDGTVIWTCRDTSNCHNFDNLAFRYSDPTKLTNNIGAVEFVRLWRFIRLWKKLGWTIEQTDAAICALYRADLAPLDANNIDDVTELDTGFLTLLPRLGIVSRVTKALNLTVKRDLLPLLACWSEIGTHGGLALYRQMFLNPTLLKQDAVFADNSYGKFLTDTTKKLADHAEALRSAFNLTGKEYDQIVAVLLDEADKPYDADTSLTISHISAIFRRGWLAGKLKLNVREFLLLTQLTGLDPFGVPDPTNPAILRLIKLVQSMKDQSLKSAAALYLIWNQDLSGKSAPGAAQIMEIGRTLRGDFASIEDQFAVTEDPNGDIARARMTLVYGQEISDAFFALLDNILVVDVTYTHSKSDLEPEITTTDAGIVYDDFRHKLSYRGLMVEEAKNNLKTVGSPDFQAAVESLFDRSEDIKGSFFGRNPELKSIYNQVPTLDSTLVLNVDYTHSEETLEDAITAADKRIRYDNTNHRLSYSGVLTAARRDILKSIPDATLEFQSALDALFNLSQRSRGIVVLAALQSELVRRRKSQQALQQLSAATGVDLAFTQTILAPLNKPYPLHAAEDKNRSGLDDVLALETGGLTAQFFFRDTATGTIDQRIPAVANLAYVQGGSNPFPNPGNAISGIWNGQVEAPEAGFYNFVIKVDGDAEVTLKVGGLDRPLTKNGKVRRNTDAIELKAGTLYEIELKVEKVKDSLSLKWETPKRAREVIPARHLYPPTIFAPFSQIYIRLLKTASLVEGLRLTANEMAFFATNPDYHIAEDGWLNALSVSGNPSPDTASALLKPLEALLDFARIKKDISPSDESLLTALKDPTTAMQNPDSLLFGITRWNKTSLIDVLKRFTGTTELGDFELFRRIYDAFVLIQKMGISATALMQATTNEPTANTIRDLQAALHARYDAADWRDVVSPINDEMRSLQRDALVAHILHQMRSNPASAHIDTADKLFEYFLMDVQMDPCMQTSRIRHALSSVQLFIERCLMNLEPRVSPAAINAEQWEWMKRYRVWEANRKIFLFPENWLEPELRDDKSPFFKEIESELLQSDITEDSATTALLNYLSKLEEVAKLEPCGIHHIPADPAKRTGEINHVIARTAGAHRKYFYRRYEYGYWTPWEHIKLDIEDNPVIPVVWKDRLLLFWLRILKQGSDTVQKPFSTEGDLTSLKGSDIKTDAPKVIVKAVLCWSEYYNGKWQATKIGDINQPSELGQFDLVGPNVFNRLYLHLRVSQEDDTLWITISNFDHSSFLLYNTHSLPLSNQDAPVRPTNRSRWLGGQYGRENFHIDYSDTSTGVELIHYLLKPKTPLKTIEPTHQLDNTWDAPFFFEDSRHVFYVTTSEKFVAIPDSSPYGPQITPNNPVPVAPPLVVKEDPRWEGVAAQSQAILASGFGIINPAPMKQFVTEDIYIHQGIGTTGSVTYDGKELGPSGVISNGRSR